jgi:cellulose synthase operon protein YhjU
MGLWSAYFIAKLLLYAGGYIGFNPWLNLLFAIFTALPPQNARQRFTKNVIAVPLGIMLLYHDSWLPPLARVLEQTHNLAAFTPEYLWELFLRFLNWKLLLAAVVLVFVYALARRKLRLSTFVFIAILVVLLRPDNPMPLEPALANATVPQAARQNSQAAIDPRNLREEALEGMLTDFYEKERLRQVRFAPLPGDDAPYDIVILHVCSLAWDDLNFVGDDNDPLLHRFDIVFDEFNTAASYSGPAAIRLLRGNCGQTPHRQLYESAKSDCLLIDGLQRVGFEPEWLMNHDGHFGDFFNDVRTHGAFPVEPEPPTGIKVVQHGFDGSPIYDDYGVLSNWWSKRLADPAPRVVLYYNSISLHDGNRVGADKRPASYGGRLEKFSSDIRQFMDDMEASGRRAIVLFVPEHGAAVRGDRRQIPGLREVPTRAITHVPVGVRLINTSPGAMKVRQRIEAPVSYLALNELLARLLADNPFAKSDLQLGSYTQNLPRTESVAENEGTTVMQIGDQSLVRMPDGEWTPWNVPVRQASNR